MKIALGDLRNSLREPIALFVGIASYESRCLTILNELDKSYSDAIFFRNTQTGEKAKDNLQKMLFSSKGKGNSFSIDMDDPTNTVRSLQEITARSRNLPAGSVFIDVTTFTHEQLLLLFRILDTEKPDRNFVFGYTGASQYSTNTDPADAWLSRGVSTVRSVLGYPGNFMPSKRLHLIILVGFEHERAQAVIEKMDPDELTLGIGNRSQSVSDKHFETNQMFFLNVRKFVSLRTNIGERVRTFDFSCIDPLVTRNSIHNEIKRLPSHNTVICPMNTKISTLGAALLGCQNKNIQVCYSRAIEYNEEGYSTPSDQVTLFEWSFRQ